MRAVLSYVLVISHFEHFQAWQDISAFIWSPFLGLPTNRLMGEILRRSYFNVLLFSSKDVLHLQVKKSENITDYVRLNNICTNWYGFSLANLMAEEAFSRAWLIWRLSLNGQSMHEHTSSLLLGNANASYLSASFVGWLTFFCMLGSIRAGHLSSLISLLLNSPHNIYSDLLQHINDRFFPGIDSFHVQCPNYVVFNNIRFNSARETCYTLMFGSILSKSSTDCLPSPFKVAIA